MRILRDRNSIDKSESVDDNEPLAKKRRSVGAEIDRTRSKTEDDERSSKGQEKSRRSLRGTDEERKTRSKGHQDDQGSSQGKERLRSSKVQADDQLPTSKDTVDPLTEPQPTSAEIPTQEAPKLEIKDQLRSVFDAPLPVYTRSSSTNGSNRGSPEPDVEIGLVGLDLAIRDIVSNRSSRPLTSDRKEFISLKLESDAFLKTHVREWGSKALEFESRHGRHLPLPVRELYEKKRYIAAGLHSRRFSLHKEYEPVSGPFSDLGFVVPVPLEFNGRDPYVQKEFRLPFDIITYNESREYGGPLTEICEDIEEEDDLQPSEFEHIEMNEYKPNARLSAKELLETPECYCKPTKNGKSCLDDCVNRALYYECGDNCPTKSQCCNRHFTSKQYVDPESLYIKRTKGRGFGLFTKGAISSGQLIVEYRGEIILTEDSIKLMDTRYQGSRNHYFLFYDSNRLIDGTRKGTVARYANHSCQPNCHMEKWLVDGHSRMGIFASKDIEPESELTYDYKFQSSDGAKPQLCYCGAPKCRGGIGINKSSKKEEEGDSKKKRVKGSSESDSKESKVKSIESKAKPKSKSMEKDSVKGKPVQVGKDTVKGKPIQVEKDTVKRKIAQVEKASVKGKPIEKEKVAQKAAEAAEPSVKPVARTSLRSSKRHVSDEGSQESRDNSPSTHEHKATPRTFVDQIFNFDLSSNSTPTKSNK